METLKNIGRPYFDGAQKRGDLSSSFLFNSYVRPVAGSFDNGSENRLFLLFKDVNQRGVLFGKDSFNVGPQSHKKSSGQIEFVSLVFF